MEPSETPSGTPEPTPTGTPEPPRGTGIHEALLKLRHSVYEGVEAGDVRDDVGLDLRNVINGMLDQGRRPRERRREDVAYLQNKIATRTREGGISGGRAEELHLILDRVSL
jgi:hypothetical protein